MATKIIEKEARALASSPLNDDATYYPIILNVDGETFSIENNGTAPAPCCVTIVPKNDVMLLTIEGLSDEPIKVEKIYSGQILVLDGINRKITLDDKDSFDIYDAWEFPRLMPGTNKIKIPRADLMTISIEYQPRFI